MRNISKFAVGLEKLSSQKKKKKKRTSHETDSHIKTLTVTFLLFLSAPHSKEQKFPEIQRGADAQACVHAEIDKSFYCSEKLAEIVPLLSNNYFFPPHLHLFFSFFF